MTIYTGDVGAAKRMALACARGTYQRNLLTGGESWNGSTLRGAAKNYGGKYAASRASLLDRLESAGLKVTEVFGPRGGRWADVEIGLCPAPLIPRCNHPDCHDHPALMNACFNAHTESESP